MILHRANERLKAPVRKLKKIRAAKKLEYALEDTFGSDEDVNKGTAQAGSGQNGEDVAGIQMQNITKANGDAAEATKKERRGKLKRVPKFPLFPDAILQDSQVENRKTRLERYLRSLLRIFGYRNHPETAEFLEVSRLSFVANLGLKAREALIKKRPGGRKAYHGCSRCCVEYCARWSKRWLVVKDSFVAYLHPRHEDVRAVLLYDKDFVVRVGASQTEGVKHGLLISNTQRDLLMKCETERTAEEWRDAIAALTHADNGPARLWLKEKRFNSFAPPRQNVHANWFADARVYWEMAANMIELAKEEIFIADWWLSPEVYMKRPMMEGNRWLLTETLKRKAEAGIHVFVLLYKEVEMALGINSWHSKTTLQGLHENIRVLRHPDHVPGASTSNVMLWAHHEKLLIVDQMVAFLGGIDLCFGRWDDHRHKLTDLGSVQYHTQQSMHKGSHSILTGMRAMVGALPALTPDAQTQADPSERSIAEVAAAAQGALENVPNIAVTEADGPISDSPDAPEASTPALPEKAIPEEKKEAAKAEKEDAETPKTKKDETPPKKSGKSPWSITKTVKSPESGSGVGASQSSEDANGRRGGNRFKGLVKKLKTERSQSEGAALEEDDRAANAKSNWKRLLVTKEGGGTVDFADLVASYKEYVASGQAVADKRTKAGTPPPERKRNKLRTMIDHWKKERQGRKGEPEDPALDYERVWNELTAETGEHDEADAANAMGGKLWIGKDYVNFIFKDFTDLDMPFMDFIDRGTTCRMPWHDIHGVVFGAAARDVARHFIQRWNVTKVEKAKYDERYPFLLPKSYTNVTIPRFIRRMSYRCNVQILRSSSLWSAGINHTEDSIQQCYLHMIANAEHYVYIENQFFVSMLNSTEVHNEISKALLERIIRAHKEGQTFRVFVNLPLMPAFEGQIGATGGSALQAVLYWTYQSISNGPHSLLHCLAKDIPDPSRYIVFTGLRQHGELLGKVITELLYIHSKLIIVDDRYALIGSANINDRSQLGKRDSEMAFYVEDSEFTPSSMNGKPYQAGKFAGSLRRWLFREHLGLLSEGASPLRPEEEQLNERGQATSVNDPVSDSFYLQTYLRAASRNTDIFEKVLAITNLASDRRESLRGLFVDGCSGSTWACCWRERVPFARKKSS